MRRAARLKVMRKPSRFWSAMHRFGFARSRLPLWRVVVEARFDREARKWPKQMVGAVAGVFVWARTIEEAEGLAALAMEEEGLQTITADAVRCAPCVRPGRRPMAMARTPFGYLPRTPRDEFDSAAERGARR